MKPAVERVEKPAEYEEVDEFVDAILDCSPFQTGALARAYDKSPDSNSIVLVARDPHGTILGSVVAVVFTHGGKLRPLVNKLTTHCTIRGSPPIRSTEASVEVIAALARGLEGAVPQETLYLRWYPSSRGVSVDPLLSLGYEREGWLDYVLDLRPSEAKILEEMSKHRRKGIRAAEKSGLATSEVTSQAELDEVYRLLDAAHKALKVPLQHPQLFRAVLSDLVPRNRAVVLACHDSGGILGGRVILVHQKSAYDWYAGSSERAKGLNADELLMWRAILAAKARGAETFDLGGAGVPDEPYGPREFKRRFGGRQVDPGRYTKVLRPATLRIAKVAQSVRGRI